MKKIIALLLVLSSIFAFSACNLIGGPDQGSTDGSATIADYNTAISATTPASANISVTIDNASPAVTLEGEYIVVYNVDGTATVSYSYDKLNQIGAADEPVTKITGIVEIGVDGSLSGSLDSTVAAAAAKKFNLDESKMVYSISMGTLDATVKANNTESVFGVAIPSDVHLIMRMSSDGKIGSFSLNYSDAKGASSIVCIYE